MITTRLDAVRSFGGMTLTNDEIEDAIDALNGLRRYVGQGYRSEIGWDGRWESLNDEDTHERVARAIWDHATDGAPWPF